VHAPQCCTFDVVSTHPLPQSVCMPGHVHTPPMQLTPTEHAWPQVPQLNVEIIRS
jgi:hypothetical protein